MNEYILIAAVGGLVYNVIPRLELWKIPKESRPDMGGWLYWLQVIIWPLLSGFLLYLYDSPELKLNKLLAFQIGISTPIIIRKMIEVSPVIPDKVTLRDKNQ